MKTKILIAAVMFLALTVAASAQALFQVGSTPVTTVASCGATELTGDIVFTQVAGSPPITAGTITVNYGVPVTTVSGATLTVTDTNGTLISTTNLTSANVSGNLVILTINTPASGTAPFTFRLSGVRVNVAGNPTLTSLSANVSSTENSFVGGQTNVVVISSIGSAIASIDTIQGTFPFTTNSAVEINAVSPVGGTVQVDVNEGFSNAFVEGARVGLTFSSIPAGVTLTIPATASTTTALGTTFTLVDSTGAPTGAVTLTSLSTNLTVYYQVDAPVPAAGVTTAETLRVPIVVGISGSAPSPLPQGSLSVTADMFPKVAPGVSYIPRYLGDACRKGPITIVTVTTGNTVLLITYAVNTLGYDTGLAIANTTADPGQDAIPQSGNLTFYFFPQTGAAFSYATGAASPGQGLSNGALNSGRIYTVLLSELLHAAGGPADFSGYIMVVANFTNAHGQYFISDWEAFTNGALMLVVDPDGRDNDVEDLDN